MPAYLRLFPLVLFCLPAIAAQAGPSDAPAETGLPQVVVKGRYDARREDTASKTVVTRADIVRYGDTNLLDVLKRLPGVTVSGAVIRLRGLGEGYTQILLDGERAPAGFAIASLAPEAIEKIEIMHAASADMSTQALAGTINIVLRKAVGTSRRQLKFSLGDEGRSLTPYLTLDDSSRSGPLSRTLVLAIAQSRFQTPSLSAERYSNAQGVPTGAMDGTGQSGGESNSIFFTPRLNWKLDGGDALNASSLLRAMRNIATTEETGVVLFGAPPGYASSKSNSQSRTGIASTNLDWLHHLDAHNVLDTKLGLSYTSRSADQRFDGVGTAFQPSLERSTRSTTTDTSLNFSGKDAATVLPQHTIGAGWDAARTQRREWRRQSDVPDQDFAVHVNRLALFVQDEWTIQARWSMYLGARWEGIDTYSAGSDIAASRSRTSVISPIAQTLWKLADTDGAQVRLALARTYTPPAVGNLNARQVLANVNTPGTPDYQGNPALRPQLAWGLDGAFEYFAADGAMFSAGGYLRRISDVTGHTLRRIGQRWVSMPDNLGEARSAGLELEAKLRWRNMDLRANLDRNWSRVSTIPGPGNRLDGQTPLSLNVSVDYQQSDSRLSAGASFGLQTGGLVRTSASESMYTGVQRNVDVYALWTRDKHLRLRLALANLLHQDGVSITSFQDAESLVRDQRERNFATARLTCEYTF